MVASSSIVSGTVYQLLLPILMDGLTTSPNMSRGTSYLLDPRGGVKAADYSEREKTVSTNA
jgi:hypothetical protein